MAGDVNLSILSRILNLGGTILPKATEKMNIEKQKMFIQMSRTELRDTISHSDAKPLSAEQIEEKQVARQKALDEISAMKASALSMEVKEIDVGSKTDTTVSPGYSKTYVDPETGRTMTQEFSGKVNDTTGTGEEKEVPGSQPNKIDPGALKEVSGEFVRKDFGKISDKIVDSKIIPNKSDTDKTDPTNTNTDNETVSSGYTKTYIDPETGRTMTQEFSGKVNDTTGTGEEKEVPGSQPNKIDPGALKEVSGEFVRKDFGKISDKIVDSKIIPDKSEPDKTDPTNTNTDNKTVSSGYTKTYIDPETGRTISQEFSGAASGSKDIPEKPFQRIDPSKIEKISLEFEAKAFKEVSEKLADK